MRPYRPTRKRIAKYYFYLVLKTLGITLNGKAIRYCRRYRTDRRRGISVGAWNKLRKRVMYRDRYKCRKCPSRKDLTVDHIVAIENGGGNEIENLQTLCRACHFYKDKYKNEQTENKPFKSLFKELGIIEDK